MAENIIPDSKYEDIDDGGMKSVLSEFHTRFFNSPNMRFSYINEKYFPDLEKGILEYFDRKFLHADEEEFSKHDSIVNYLTPISNAYEQLGLLRDAQEFLGKILIIFNTWRETRGRPLHRGSIFFFWAKIAIINGELDKGFFLIHKSFKEDQCTHKLVKPGTPAEKTVRLDDNKSNYLNPFVMHLWNRLDTFINKYNSVNLRNISKEQIFIKFTSAPPSDDILFSFTHALTKIDQQLMLGIDIISSDFAGLYELNLLFDLVLVIDKTIYTKIPPLHGVNEWKFFHLANRLLITSKIENVEGDCEKNLVNAKESQEKIDFEKTIIDLLDNKFIFDAPKNITSLYRDVCLSYCIRNHSAHNITLTTTIANRFPEISQSVFNVLFLCIETI